MGLEPTTPSLEGWRSTTELHPQKSLELTPGLEPGSPPYQGGVLPLYYVSKVCELGRFRVTSSSAGGIAE